MSRASAYVLLVLTIGSLITWFLVTEVLGMPSDRIGSKVFWYLLTLWAVFPALLSALPKRIALIILALFLAAMVGWAYLASSATDDGGLAMGIIIVAATVTSILSGFAIAGREPFLGRPSN